LGNKKLLWHGSRFSNFVGILSQGLRIAPPEAPSTGYLFGKGVYFADIIQKSWPYACPNLSNNVGIYILATVALGNTRELKNIDYNAANLPVGKNSTHAIGR
jgi:poly [ADP-ribose] polymerase